MGVGRGVIVIVIGMIMARAIGVIVGSVRLRWRMAIDMVVILTVLKSLRSVYESENDKAKGPIGKEQEVGSNGEGGRVVSLVRLPPLCPHTSWPLGLDGSKKSITPSTREGTTHDAQHPGPQPTRECDPPFHQEEAVTRRPRTAGCCGGGLGRTNGACVRLAVCVCAVKTEPCRGGLRM